MITVPLPTGDAGTDQSNIDQAQAQAASLSQALRFPDGQTYLVTTGVKIGDNLGPVPLAVYGEHTTLKATVAGGRVVSISNPHNSGGIFHFKMEGFILDAARLAYRCLSIHGSFWAEYHRIECLNAASIGFAIDAGRGFGCYYNQIHSIHSKYSAYLGMQWHDDLQTIATDGPHIQGNDIHDLQMDSCALGGGSVRGMQGSLRTSQFQENGGWGLMIANSGVLGLDDCYFEANLINGVDSAVFVDDATVFTLPPNGDGGVQRRGGHWIGRTQGTINVK